MVGVFLVIFHKFSKRTAASLQEILRNAPLIVQMAHFLCISLMGVILYPYGDFNPSPVSYESPVANPLVLITFKMTSTNLSPELDFES